MSALFDVVLHQALALGVYLVFLRNLLGGRLCLRAAVGALACLVALAAVNLVCGRAGVPGLSIFERNALNIVLTTAVLAAYGWRVAALPVRAAVVWSMVFVATQQSAHKLYAYVVGPMLGSSLPWFVSPVSDAVQVGLVFAFGLGLALLVAPTRREALEPGAVGPFQTVLLAFVLADCAVLVLQGDANPFPVWQAWTNAFQCLVPAVGALVIKGTVAYNCRLLDAGRVTGLAKAAHARLVQKIRSDDEIRRVYHDLRSTLSALHSEEEVHAIMGALDARRPEGRRYCLDPMLDMLLNEASRRCRDAGVRFEVETNMGCGCGMCDEDLCLVLGNAFANALDAARAAADPGRRYVSFSAVEHPAMLVMTVSNGYEGPLRRDGRAFLTTKSDRASHGMGLRSVEEVLGRYGGVCKAQAESGTFELTMGLPRRMLADAPGLSPRTGVQGSPS